MQTKNKTKKYAKGIATIAAFFLVASPIQAFAAETTSTASAISTLASNVNVYELDMNDQAPTETLKTAVVEKYVASNATIKMDNVDLENTTITTTAYDRTKSGLQTINISVSIVTKSEDESTNATVGLDYTETAAIKMVEPEGPQVILKAESVTVDLGSTFNYAENLGILSTKDGSLPAIKETDNVDVDTEGTYSVSITAIDVQGAKTTVSYDVVVVKPAEVIRAEEEAAAAAAAAEEAARIAAEQAAQQAAQQAAIAQASYAAASYDVASNPTGSSIADYALSFVGSAYVWGGSSPAGFDCSGFTQYVYGAYGYSMAHSSYAQETYGTIVSVDQAEAGDLVTYNGHTGIYIGNGMMVNAMNPSQGVAVCSIYAITNGNMLIHRLG